MTITAEGSRTVRASGREVLEVVLDLERYRRLDHKIGRISRPVFLDENDEATVRFWGRMRGTPPTPDTHVVRLTRWSDLTFTAAANQPARLIFEFTGRFHCVDTAAGCQVTHGYEIDFRRPFRWVYEPLLRTWLQSELDAELDRLQATFD